MKTPKAITLTALAVLATSWAYPPVGTALASDEDAEQDRGAQPRAIYTWVDDQGNTHFVDEDYLVPAGQEASTFVELPAAAEEEEEPVAVVEGEVLAEGQQLLIERYGTEFRRVEVDESQAPAEAVANEDAAEETDATPGASNETETDERRTEGVALGRDRTYWQTRTREAQTALEEARIAILQADEGYRESADTDPMQDLSTAEEAWTALQEEARRAGARRAWVQAADE